jgi:hypothetical protein
MARTVHARIDRETELLLARLRRRTGLSESEILREGLKAVARDRLLDKGTRIVGLGQFASGEKDLGSNQRHLVGFGRK